jgi:GNAT superfamily N-acetyltransferase
LRELPSLTVGLLTRGILGRMKILRAESSEQIEQARELFREYEAWIEVDLCFQSFAKELAGLPGDYAAPEGRLLLVFEKEKLAGCIALRKLGRSVCEMKRLFVRPEFHGKGIGRQLVDAIVREAREIGYQKMRLDTIPPKMNKAISIYRSMGFKEIEPYYATPVPGAKFMELAL